MKTYLCRFTYSKGNGYALVTANRVSGIENILRAQGMWEGVHVLDCKELDICIPLCGTLVITATGITTLGMSAYDLAVDAGFKGTTEEWLASLIGPKGDKGDKGDSGEGIASGGREGQILKKNSNADYDTRWEDLVIPDTLILSDWALSDSTKVDFIKNKPTIPAALVQSDWRARAEISPFVSNPAYIRNKPTNVSAFENDIGYVESRLLDDTLKPYAVKGDVYTPTNIQNNGYDYVDMGLPSGTLWCNHNVGYTDDDMVGTYFAWGEIIGYQDTTTKLYTWDDYKWYSDGLITKYTQQELESLLGDDDAAAIIQGGTWQIPTMELWFELFLYSKIRQEHSASGEGYRLTSKVNGNTLFFPSLGYLLSDEQAGYALDCAYWSNQRESSNSYFAKAAVIDYEILEVYSFNRCQGFPVRGVLNNVQYAAKFLTLHLDISGKANKSEMSVVDGTGTDADKTTITLKTGTSATVLKSHQSLADKQDKMSIVTWPSIGNTATVVTGSYNKLSPANTINTLQISLSHNSENKIQTVVIYMETGTTPAITWVPSTSGEAIYIADGFEIEASSTYEVNALWNGTNWYVAGIKLINTASV